MLAYKKGRIALFSHTYTSKYHSRIYAFLGLKIRVTGRSAAYVVYRNGRCLLTGAESTLLLVLVQKYEILYRMACWPYIYR